MGRKRNVIKRITDCACLKLHADLAFNLRIGRKLKSVIEGIESLKARCLSIGDLKIRKFKPIDWFRKLNRKLRKTWHKPRGSSLHYKIA
ncbi:MAG: hypothetical protein EBV28_10720 [Betaproteobacteria bacterium]|nr:hypothetical protein [Betaproteobacteria bacterium]